MKTYNTHSLYDGASSCALTLGTFDGVHLGHQKVLKQMVQYSKKHSCPSVVFTFDSHPLQWVNPQSGVRRIFSIEEIKKDIQSLGVDYLIVEKFSKQFADISPFDFFKEYIQNTFKPSCLFVGYDLKFGRNREGDIQLLKDYAQKFSFDVQEIGPEFLNNRIISSSWIRETFHQSDFETLQHLRGQPFCFEGEVISGEARGSRIGFPTANIQTFSPIPQKGVYICQLSIHGQIYPSVMNIGTNPTFSSDSESRLKVEVHSLSKEKLSLQGEKVHIFVLKRIRDEKKFLDIPSLQKQIREDIQKALNYFD